MTKDELGSGMGHKLMAYENWESPLRQKYEAEVEALIVRKLSRLQKINYLVVSIVMVLFSGLTGWVAATTEQLPLIARLLLIEGTVFQLVAAAFCWRVVRGGVFHARRHPVFFSGLMWCFSVLLAVHFLLLIPEVPSVQIALVFLGISLVTMFGTGIQLLRTCIEQAELNTHERLLETVLRLTDSRDESSDEDR